MPISISQTIKKAPSLPFLQIAEHILGKKYNVSLVFVGNKRAQKINQETRNKSYTPNILAFPLSATAGEIFITPSVARKEAKNFNLTELGYVGYLFIHGCLHLKGLDHGSAMEKLESATMKKFALK